MPADLPSFVPPALARPGELPEHGWSLEVKWDGMRGQARWDGRRVVLRSRPGRDCSADFPELVRGLAQTLAGMRPLLVDGEVVCFDADGHPDFGALRRRLVGGPGPPATFMAFDVLHAGAASLLTTPYRDRRVVLEAVLGDGPSVRVPRPLDASPAEAMAVLREHHLEGAVAKRWDGVYASGRRHWVKHKIRRSETVLIRGWRPSERRGVELLVVGAGQRGAAGAISFVAPEARTDLRRALDASAHRLERGTRWLDQPLLALADGHGRPGRPLRDAVLRRMLEP